jgi:O-antigen/teichoic acid export membrane protein
LFSEGKHAEGNSLVLKSLQLMYALTFLALAGISGVAPTFATFYFGKGFGIVSILMMIQVWMMPFFGIASVLRGQYLMSMRRMKEITIASVLALTVNIIFNVLLVPSYGAIGASVATVATELIASSYLFWTVRDNFKPAELFKDLWKYILSSGLTFVVVSLLNRVLPVNLMTYVVQALAGVTVYFIGLVVLKVSILSDLGEMVGKFRKKK